MPQGLQTFNENGIILLDTSTRVSFILGTLRVSATGTLRDSRLLDGIPFYMIAPPDTGVSNLMPVNPTVEINGDTISYFVVAGWFSRPFRLIYGIR
ncbi:hypothetical protein [Galbibacter sp. BG1]